MTYTAATLEISKAAFDEIKEKLIAAGHQHAIDAFGIDMSKIIVTPGEVTSAPGNKPAAPMANEQAFDLINEWRRDWYADNDGPPPAIELVRKVERHLAVQPALVLTEAMIDAAEAYLKRVGPNSHGLPALFRWHDMWAEMMARAAK